MDQQQQCTLNEWLISKSDFIRKLFPAIQLTLYYVCPRIWKEMSLNDSLSELERSKLAVWDYPVSDKYTKVKQNL